MPRPALRPSYGVKAANQQENKTGRESQNPNDEGCYLMPTQHTKHTIHNTNTHTHTVPVSCSFILVTLRGVVCVEDAH